MATRKETVKVCDGCGTEQRFNTDGGYVGGHPLSGWVEIHEHGGSTMLSELQKKRDHDFCGKKCLLDFLQNDQAQRPAND
jgi:hypothetical protein